MNKERLITFLEREAAIEVIATQDEIEVKGNACAIDDETDERVEREILDRLDSGDVWAWASVEVRATFGDWSGSDYLGCCSYKDEADFTAPGGYYDDMRQIAIADLADTIINAKSKIDSIAF